jgi:hypothetical protein
MLITTHQYNEIVFPAIYNHRFTTTKLMKLMAELVALSVTKFHTVLTIQDRVTTLTEI